jgi:nitrogen-specific signal transduction histidine kinase
VKFGLLPFVSSDDAKTAYPGLELLATAVLLLNRGLMIVYANAAAENLFELSKRQLAGHRPAEVFGEAQGLLAAVEKAVRAGASYSEQELCTSPARYRRSTCVKRRCCSSSATSTSS